ncbi:MAG: hypothetical protein P8R54_31440 [Myxococcota bacterium]|nr:hypothetical protein [Myxococcota bacterium]
MSMRFLALILLCACGDKTEDDTGDDNGITTGGSSDVAGDWEGVCAFPDGDINIDMVLNQKDRDLTGGADIWIVESSDTVLEYDGNITGTVTLDNIDMELVADKYGTLKMDAYLSSSAESGEKLIGTCKAPDGASGNLALSR